MRARDAETGETKRVSAHREADKPTKSKLREGGDGDGGSEWDGGNLDPNPNLLEYGPAQRT